MASGFKVASVDLDLVFKARTSAKIADVGFLVAAVDISNRYEGSTGGDQISYSTNFKKGTADLKTLFRDFAYSPGAPTVTLSASTASGSASGGGFLTATSNSITATPAGGTPGYTYLWQFQGGDGSTAPDFPTLAATTFSRGAVAPETDVSTWRCRVTDSLGAIGYSPNLVVTLTFTP